MTETDLILRQANELRDLLDRHRVEREEHESVSGPLVFQRYELASNRAVRFLGEVLSSGPITANEVRAQARRAGIGQLALMAGKRGAGIVSVKRGAQWFWQLPDLSVQA